MEHPPSGELELRRDGSFALEVRWPPPAAVTFGALVGEPGTMTGKWVGDLGDEGLVHLFVHRDPDASDLVLLTYLDGATFHLPQRVVSAVPCGTRSHRLSRNRLIVLWLGDSPAAITRKATLSSTCAAIFREAKVPVQYA